MPTFDGVSATIRVDGADVTEFSVERDIERRRVVCWIPSQVDKEFEVIVDSGNRARGPWGADVSADGRLTSRYVFMYDKSSNVGYYQKSSTVDRPFAFSKLDLVDDDALLQSSQSIRIGEVEVSCRTVEITRSYYDPTFDRTFNENSRIHERSKKGLSEHIGFKKEIHRDKPCKFYATEDLEHICTFVFRYRPLAYLQAQRIAPITRQTTLAPVQNRHRNASAGPSNAGPSTSANGATGRPIVISDWDDEVQEVQGDELAQTKTSLKRKQRADNGSPRNKRVKVEGQPRFLPNEVIDLT